MIVKNEAAHLKMCLDSVVEWVDEIVIVDSGSEDETVNIAKSYTQSVYTSLPWPGFGKQRQIAQSHMTTDWVLALDADEVVSEELKKSLLRLADTEALDTCFLVNRFSKAFGKYIKHSGWSPDWIIRFYPRNLTQYNDDLVHEKILVPDGAHVKKVIEGVLLHDTYDNLHHYISKTTGYLKAWSDQREGKKKSSLMKALIHAWGCFIKMYFIKLGFLDGKHGFILAWLGMHSTFVKYIDLWLREQRNEN
ncbi:glycosyltransferase family 2 protein [Marinomonas sp. C2222]|uniref:Glycosyltransferase family 2 protein n=1 Tax=Marinomonas sargassi TaxID=2984494 RepID=A0ABT2YNH0_9GAMM|nr:glycosyltransferase family 2 protein [Marinomonas sargassi]MCV2401430.1 glycosyltransferase family 2 protein [Marinomonas sargassi]